MGKFSYKLKFQWIKKWPFSKEAAWRLETSPAQPTTQVLNPPVTKMARPIPETSHSTTTSCSNSTYHNWRGWLIRVWRPRKLFCLGAFPRKYILRPQAKTSQSGALSQVQSVQTSRTAASRQSWWREMPKRSSTALWHWKSPVSTLMWNRRNKSQGATFSRGKALFAAGPQVG